MKLQRPRVHPPRRLKDRHMGRNLVAPGVPRACPAEAPAMPRAMAFSQMEEFASASPQRYMSGSISRARRYCWSNSLHASPRPGAVSALTCLIWLMRPSASAGCACKYIPAYLRKAVLHAENVLMVRGGRAGRSLPSTNSNEPSGRVLLSRSVTSNSEPRSTKRWLMIFCLSDADTVM